MPETLSFNSVIESNKNAEQVSPETTHLETDGSSLDVRLRGCYITNCELTSPTSGERASILYSDEDLSEPKISASHIMMPAGPNQGIGGQHGFPRWADYLELPVENKTEIKKVGFQALSPEEGGLLLEKFFSLSASSLESHTKVSNLDSITERTSLGEHKYFNLEGGNFEGLKINGKTLDELLGEGSLAHLMHDADGTLSWLDFNGEARIDFPAGYSLNLSADFKLKDGSEMPVAMWIWHRKDTPSICFEPVVGLSENSSHDGIELVPEGVALLRTKIELL